jgi:uncharacterized protein (TIRG00374 family)
MKRTGYLIISIALTAIIGYVLYRSVPDWGQAGAVMISGKPLWFLGGLTFVALHMFLRSLRWGVLLTPVKAKISKKNLLSLTLIKYVINIIPPRVGEVAGSLILAKKEKIPASSVIAATVFERVLDTLAVLVLFGFYMIFFAGKFLPTSERGKEIFGTIRTSAMIVSAVMVIALIILAMVLHSRRWHDHVPGIIRKHVLSFMDGLRALQSKTVAAKALVLSLLIWLSISAQLWCYTRAYLGDFPFAGALLIMAITVVGVAIPTPGGVGGFQFFMNLCLIHFFQSHLSGTDPNSQAAGISNGVYILSMGPVILTGLILLHREGLSLSRAASLSAESRT